MYTSIPHELGLKAIEHFLDNFPTTLQRPFSKEFILKAISIVLKENTFKFDGKNHKRVQGNNYGNKNGTKIRHSRNGLPRKTVVPKNRGKIRRKN